MGAACARRKQALGEAGETPFWEEVTKPAKRAEDDDEDERQPTLVYEQATHLKDEGNEKFARGDTTEAMDSWIHALDALSAPAPPSEHAEDADAIPPRGLGPSHVADPKVQELRVSLLLNLAVGHKKLLQFRHAVSYCDEALLGEPTNVKALYRKADALGELLDWKEAEEVASRLADCGEEGRKLALQKRDEWRRKRKAADGKQKKMWSAALAEPAPPKVHAKKEEKAAEAEAKEKPKPVAKPEVERWTAPRVEAVSVFDLRRKGITWVEKEDFDDSSWRDGLGRKEATFYQSLALPLTLLSAAALAELDFGSELVIHCILDGNIAPFAQPHDWSALLKRCASVRSLTVVYIDIGCVGDVTKDPNPSMPYGTLLRPTEEGRVGDRVARAARFLGTYREFREHCRDLPGLNLPTVALWADVPFYGFNEDDFAVRLEAYEAISAMGVASVFTQGGEIQEPGGPPFAPKVDEQSSLSMAVLKVGLGARMACAWRWNRFVVPLDRSELGILAAHALVGVTKPAAKAGTLTGAPLVAAVKARLKQRSVALVPFSLPKMFQEDKSQLRKHQDAANEMRKKQWEAFMRKLKDQGRPVGPDVSAEERNRQAMEFYQFCGLGDGATA